MFSQGYIIDSQICILVLYLLYRTMLEGRISHRAARSYLLTMIPVALLLPMFAIPLLPAPSLTHIISSTTEQFTSVIVAEPAVQTSNYLLIAYITGVVLMTLWILIGAIKLMTLMRKSRPERIEGLRVIFANQKITAYSVFNYIFINATLRNSGIINELLAHEECHIRFKHSMDLIYMSTMRALLWFNPTVWHIGSMLRQVHEYQVDEDVISQGYSKVRYVNLLIITETGITPELTSPFSYSLTKKRLMMLSMKDKCRSQKRLLLLLPIIIGLVFCFSLTTKASSEPMTIVREQPLTVVETQTPQQEQVVEVEVTSDNSATLNISTLHSEAKTRVITEVAKIVTLSETVPINTSPTSSDESKNIYRTKVRGSLSEDNPLVVLNGEIFNESIADISPENVEAITVLKDQAALSIYGPRAKNGAILITTKDGGVKVHQKEYRKTESTTETKPSIAQVTVVSFGEQKKNENDPPVISADVMPKFRGGDENTFRQWVQHNVAYHAEAQQNGIQDKVILQFIIDRQGEVRNVKVLSGVNKFLNDAAVKTIESSPRWTPGSNNGKPINVTFTIPIEFKLQN